MNEAFPSIRAFLDKKSMNQQEFADLIGVSQPTVSDWLSGKIAPSLFNLRKISEETGIKVQKLIDEMLSVA